MFFDHLTRRKASVLSAPPPIPANGWQPPRMLPDLRSAAWIGIDTETYDPELLTYGPGWARKRGHLVGVSLASDAGSWYFPLRHSVQSELNLDATIVIPYLREMLQFPHIPKIGANLIYDIGWLAEENIFVEGELHDIQFAEALLTETSPTALDHLAHKYLSVGKTSSKLYEWLASYYDGKADDKQRANIYRAPPSLVGPYAEADAALPYQILCKQWPLLHQENLLDVYRMECDLIYLLVQMRRDGVTIDLDCAEQLKTEFDETSKRLNQQLFNDYGLHSNIHSSDDLTKLFNHLGLKYPTSTTGRPSFRKDVLDTIEHPVADQIKEIRKFDILNTTFVQSYLLDANINGKVYGQFHPLRGMEGGTRSGRFASSDPNLQNLPGRSNEGKQVRSAFIPDNKHIGWLKLDYSQIEYRLLAHFAIGNGSDELREHYNNEPTTDYHSRTQQAVKNVTGFDIARGPIKNVNFGLVYGMSEKKLARQIGIPTEQATELFTAYHTGNPYVRATMNATANEANILGYITTLSNRRSRFELWQPSSHIEDRFLALPYAAARDLWGASIKRAFLHKAINRRLQGSAADILKAAMLRLWREGVFLYTGFPRLTVHDELDFSVIDNTHEQQEAYQYIKHVMETATPIRVPTTVDAKFAANWGEAG